MLEKLELEQMYFLLFLLAASLIMIAPFGVGQAVGPTANYRNVSVATTLNITNSNPQVLSVVMDQSITLSAGVTTEILCNSTVQDLDYIGTVNVNATLFDMNTVTLTSPDDGNNHYTNASCYRYQNDSYNGNFTCAFQVQYYANNGTNWNCTVRATDDFNITDSGYNSTTIEPLLALNLTPGTIDYGNMQVGDISNITQANVSNLGNIDINITVRGYGATEGDNLAMVCEFNDIPVDEQRFSMNATDVWTGMNQMSSSNQYIQNLSLVQRTVDAPGGEIFNATYWRIRVPAASNPGGECNGTLIFQAELA